MAQDVLENCLCSGRGRKRIRNVEKEVLFFRHDDLPGEEIYCVPKFAKVIEEGSPDNAEDPNQIEEEQPREIPQEVQQAGNVSKYISLVCANGFMVDDDNDAAPENVPDLNPTEGQNNIHEQTWGWNGNDHRRIFGAQNNRPHFQGMANTFLGTMSYCGMFLILFPKLFIENVIVEETNKHLEKNLTLGEFLQFVGIWFVISYLTPCNMNRREFWSSKPTSREGGAPFWLNDNMSSNRFEEIIKHLTFTNIEPPSFTDKFWEIRQMVEVWNTNMRVSSQVG